MIGRFLAWGVGVVALVATGLYTGIYVYRWEWNRALLVAVLFVAAELALGTALVLRRLRAISVAPAAERRDRLGEVRSRLEAHRPRRDHFAWMREQTTGLSVFVTLLLGAGAVFTVGAWVIDRVASRTAGPTLERSLARRLERLSFPDGPLVPDDDTLMAEAGPYGVEHLELLLGPRR